jgi:multiple sugar transport system substrate-binding protein
MNGKALSRRQFLQMMGITVAGTSLAACVMPAAPGAGQPEAAGDAGASAETPTLRYRTWHSPGASEGEAAWYDWLAENYTAAAIEIETVPFGPEYIQKVLADSAAGTPPDLLHSSIIWAREFYDRGVLLELDEYLADVPELAPDQFYGEATNHYRSKDGKFYGVPWEGPDSAILCVNSQLLEEAGFDPQGADIETWDDLIEAAVAMTKYDGDEVVQAGYLVQSFRSIQNFQSWLVSNGGAMSNDEFTEASFNNDQGREVLQLELSLLNEHKVSFPISPERQDQQLFVQGQVGMWNAGTWSTTTLNDLAPEGFRYWFIVYPQGPQGSGRAGTTWSNMFVLPQGTGTSDASFELLKYCTTPPVVITRFELSTRTTPHKAIFESAKWGEVLERAPQREVTIAAAEKGGIYPFFPFFTEANDAIGIELEQVMTGAKGVDEGLEEADRKIAEVISRRTQA